MLSTSPSPPQHRKSKRVQIEEDGTLIVLMKLIYLIYLLATRLCHNLIRQIRQISVLFLYEEA